VEGYSSIAEQKSLRGFFHHKDIKTICETGFNAGHSAANYLLANYLGYNVRYVGFDLGRTPYSKAAADFLKTLFPQHFEVHWGDSTKTLPGERENESFCASLYYKTIILPRQARDKHRENSKQGLFFLSLAGYMAEHPGLICDGIMVDGGHNYETSKADLRAFLTRARCGTRVAIDDIEMPALRKSWKEAQDEGFLREGNCETSRDPDAVRNWCFATVVRLPPHKPSGVTHAGVDNSKLPAIETTACEAPAGRNPIG
jgi:hypothetical protein